MLGVGLTRPFAPTAGEPPLHWLQVNNLHLEDDPAWRLVSDTGPARHGYVPSDATMYAKSEVGARDGSGS